MAAHQLPHVAGSCPCGITHTLAGASDLNLYGQHPRPVSFDVNPPAPARLAELAATADEMIRRVDALAAGTALPADAVFASLARDLAGQARTLREVAAYLVRRNGGGVPQATPSDIRVREGGRCFRCGRATGNGGSCHHRIRRREGGNGYANQIHVCGGGGTTGCHGWIGKHARAARDAGYIVTATTDVDPSNIPAEHWQLGLVLLGDDGRLAQWRP